MRKIYLMISVLVLLATACQERWNDYYGEAEDERSAGATKTMYEMLKEHEMSYSRFISMLDKTGVAEQLKGDRVLTLWVPHNDYVTDEMLALDSIDMRRLVLNHLNSLAFYQSKLATKWEIQTLAGKYANIRNYNRTFYLEKAPVRKFDMACSNGVIHELAGVLVPMKNLMEYINECGADYSIIRDSLWAYNDTTFDLEASFPIGVDPVGQTIYDSVFIIENELLKSVNPMNERASYTLFLPSNAIIENALRETKAYFDAIGREFVAEDSISCFQWILKSVFVSGAIENLNNIKTLYSSGGSILRFDKQVIKTDYERCSNGVVYKYDKMYMPRAGYMKKVDFFVPNVLEIPEAERANYFRTYNNSVPGLHYTGSYIDLRVNKEGDWIELCSVFKNKYAEVLPAKLMPGKYKLSGSFYGWRNSNTKFYLNGEALFYRNTYTNNFPTGNNSIFESAIVTRMCDTVIVKEQAGYNMAKIRIETQFSGSDKNYIRVGSLIFEPLSDNY